MLERAEDRRSLAKRMTELAAKCACKGKCSNRKGSCVKRGEKCLGYSWDSDKCEKKVIATQVHDTVYVLQEEQMETIEDVGGGTMMNVYNSQDEIEGEAAHLLGTIAMNGRVEFEISAVDQICDEDNDLLHLIARNEVVGEESAIDFLDAK